MTEQQTVKNKSLRVIINYAQQKNHGSPLEKKKCMEEVIHHVKLLEAEIMPSGDIARINAFEKLKKSLVKHHIPIWKTT
jgi:hypothetical protein